MTLEAEMNARLDSSGLMATLTGELDGSVTDLKSLDLSVSIETADGGATAATSIDLAPINDTVSQVLGELDGVIENLPQVDALVGPVLQGIELLEAALEGDLEAKFQNALTQVDEEFKALREGDTLTALRRLAEVITSSGDLAEIQAAIMQIVQLLGGPDLPKGGLGDVIAALLDMLETIGALMTLETMIAEGARLAGVVKEQLPDGAVADMEATYAAAIAQLEAALNGLDVASDAAVDAAVEAMLNARMAARAFLSGLTEAMAFGEATLTYVDPEVLVKRAEATLVKLRGIAVAELEAVMAKLAGHLAPLASLDMSTMPTTPLESLLTDLEARSAELAAEVATVDLGPITDPLTSGLGSVAGVVDDVRTALEQGKVAVEDGLGQVRDAVAALPIDQVVGALTQVTDLIAGVLAELGDLLSGIQASLEAGANAASAAISRAETAIDDFRAALDSLFGEAKTFVDGLGLDNVAGAVADEIQNIADIIGQADMTPYFSTAQGAIDTTAGVIDAVPFALLPDEMEEDVIALVRPIKTADANAFSAEIKDILQIAPDGSFALRGELEAAVNEVQLQFDALVAALANLDPQKLADALNEALDDVKTEIEKVAPAAELKPLTDALEQAKGLVKELDLNAVLKPLEDGFDAVLEQVDAFTPSTLLAPLDAQVDALRQKVIDLIKLDQWGPTLDDTKAQALELVNLVDPTQLEAPIKEAFAEVQRRVSSGEVPDPLGPIGAMVSSLMSGSGESVTPSAFIQVSAWIKGKAIGADRLTSLTSDMQQAIGAAKSEVAKVDPSALSARVKADTDQLDALVALLPAGEVRDRLQRGADALDISADLAAIGPHHARFLSFLTEAEAKAGALAARGFGEVDTIGGSLRVGLQPLTVFVEAPRIAFERLGFKSFSRGVTGLMEDLFEVATPERIAGLLTPIFAAVHGRVDAILDALINPLKDMIDDLQGIIDVFDLSALTEGLDAIHAEIRADIAAFHPDILLASVKTAFADAQEAIEEFDPLAPILATLEEVKEATLRILEKLDGDEILAVPIEIFADIMALLEALNINDLLNPLYDQLDAIAAQVTDGLDGTVESFIGLQDALPDKIGSVTISANVSVNAN